MHHSEYNPSAENRTHMYQVWLRPDEKGGEPRYAEKRLGDSAVPNALTLLFSGDGRDGSTAIRQNAEIAFGHIDAGNALEVAADADRPHAWLQVISGNVSVLGQELSTADGLAIENEPGAFEIRASADAKFLLFRLS